MLRQVVFFDGEITESGLGTPWPVAGASGQIPCCRSIARSANAILRGTQRSSLRRPGLASDLHKSPTRVSGVPPIRRHPFPDRVVRLVNAVVRAAVDGDGSLAPMAGSHAEPTAPGATPMQPLRLDRRKCPVKSSTSLPAQSDNLGLTTEAKIHLHRY